MSYDAWKADWPGYADRSEEREDDALPEYRLYFRYKTLYGTIAQLVAYESGASRIVSESYCEGDDPREALRVMREQRRLHHVAKRLVREHVRGAR